MEAIERYEISFEKTHEKHQIDTILELSLELSHLEIDLIEVLIAECEQRTFHVR